LAKSGLAKFLFWLDPEQVNWGGFLGIKMSAVFVFILLSLSAQAASRRIQIDCGQGVFLGTLTAELDTSNWLYSCTDWPRQSTFIRMETLELKIKAGKEIFEAQEDRQLNSGFANRVSFEPNSCDQVAKDFSMIGVHALFKRFWHPEFGGRFPVSLKDQDGNTSLLLLDLEKSPKSTLAVSGTILSSNQGCNFTLSDQE
jgi:hypothetical protein